MHSPVRNSVLWLVLIAFLGIWVFIGCGGGGGSGGGDNPFAYLSSTGHISGTVTASGTLASIRTIAPEILAAVSGSQGIDGAEVYLESNRDQYHTITATGGKFDLAVPYGTNHRVVAVFRGSMGTFKVRSNAITISETSPAGIIQSFDLAPANRYVRGTLLDKNGIPLPFAQMVLWGEPFTTNASGEYTTPALPQGSEGEIKVKATGYQETIIPATFNAPNPPYIITTIPTSGDTNRAPIVTLKTDSYERTAPGKTRNVTAVITDADNDNYTFDWKHFGGSLSTSTGNLTAVWTAPSGNGVATVTVTATDSRGLSGIAYLGIEYGLTGGTTTASGTNIPPFVNIIATGTNYYTKLSPIVAGATNVHVNKGAVLKLIANATDDDGDALTYFWFCSTGAFANSRLAEVDWTAPNNATFAFIDVFVYDTKNGVASTSKTIGVGNNPPTVKINSPVKNTVYNVGGISLLAKASDTLYASEIFPGSGFKASWLLGNKTIATDTLSSSYSFANPGTLSLTLQVTDSIGAMGSDTVSFHINATPTSRIASPPTNNMVFKSGAPITFAGVASDSEDGILGESLFWYYNLNLIGTGSSFTYTGFTSLGSYTVWMNATDSHGGASDYASITVNILGNNPPTVKIASPSNDSTYLTGSSVTFQGLASDTEDGNLTGTSVAWYDVTKSNWLGSGTTISTSALATGSHTIRFVALDAQKAIGSTTIAVYINTLPTAKITAPPTGSSYAPGESISFTGQASDAEEVGVISDDRRLGWFDGAWGVNWLASGTSFTNTSLSVGNHTITFGGIDSRGAVATDSITLGVGNRPNMTFTPASNTVYLQGATVTFTGSGTDADTAAPISATTFKWYDNGTLQSTYNGSTTWSTTVLSLGSHTISLEGTSANLILGTMTKVIGINAAPTVTLASPTLNRRVDVGTNFTLVGSATDAGETNLELGWYFKNESTGGAVTFIASQTALTSGQTYTYTTGSSVGADTLTHGTCTVYLFAKDSMGSVGVATTTILINRLPSSLKLALNPSSQHYATGPSKLAIVRGNWDGTVTNLPIAVNFTFGVSGTDGDTDTLTYTWSSDAFSSVSNAFSGGGGTTDSYNLKPGDGIATITVRVSDTYSLVEVASQGFKAWISDIPALPGGAIPLTTISGIDLSSGTNGLLGSDYPFMFSMAVPGDNKAYRYWGTGTGLLGFNAGGNLDSDATFTFSVPSGITSLATGSTDPNIYVIEKGNVNPTDVVRPWNIWTLQQMPPTPLSVGLSDPEGITFDGNNLYISDTGANRIVKIASGNATILSSTSGITAYGINYNNNNVYAALNSTGVVRKYNTSLNFLADITASNPYYIHTSGKHLFVQSRTGVLADGKVQIFDLNGNLQTEFCKYAATVGDGEMGGLAGGLVYWIYSSTDHFLVCAEGTRVQSFYFGKGPFE